MLLPVARWLLALLAKAGVQLGPSRPSGFRGDLRLRAPSTSRNLDTVELSTPTVEATAQKRRLTTWLFRVLVWGHVLDWRTGMYAA
jgi:hypothetical protein